MTTITEHTEVLRRMCRHRIDKMYDPDYKHAKKYQRENNEEYAALCAGITALEALLDEPGFKHRIISKLEEKK